MLGALVALVGPDGPGGALAQTSTGPRMTLSTTEVDVGRLEFGRFVVRSAVSVGNTGGVPLTIRKVRSTCPCVKATLTSTRLAPGEAATLAIEADGSALVEPLDESVLLYSDDPGRPLVKVHVHGTIRRPIDVVPVALAIGVSRRRQLISKRMPPFHLKSSDGMALGPLSVEPSAGFIEATARTTMGGEHEVQVRFLPSLPLGPLRESVRVRTAHPAQPVIVIPVFGVVTGDLQPARRIDFGLVEEGRPATVRFSLPNAGPRETEILGSELALPVPGEVQIAKTGRDFEIVVRVPSPPALASLRGVLTLRTDDPEEPVVALKVSGAVLSRGPFEESAASPGGEARLADLVSDALSRGHRISVDDFFAKVLGGVRDQRAVTLLLGIASDHKDTEIRMRALELLGALKSPHARDTLRRLVTDDDHEFVRRPALGALVETIGAEAIPDLLMAIEDDAAWVREDAATLLGRVGDRRALRALQRATRDPDADARDAARQALDALRARLKQ
jgi:hypothetical protein